MSEVRAGGNYSAVGGHRTGAKQYFGAGRPKKVFLGFAFTWKKVNEDSLYLYARKYWLQKFGHEEWPSVGFLTNGLAHIFRSRHPGHLLSQSHWFLLGVKQLTAVFLGMSQAPIVFEGFLGANLEAPASLSSWSFLAAPHHGFGCCERIPLFLLQVPCILCVFALSETRVLVKSKASEFLIESSASNILHLAILFDLHLSFCPWNSCSSQRCLPAWGCLLRINRI